ncbi:glycosyl transferase family protein [Lacticaseibacillus paracasei subsp. paracasei Lpp126]|uniref:Glycosyl transferase family protein n=1 Tax=Lacticaseibacillus paracasei subsp. paracasei Lpp126 TaxID=1256206 RepID=S2QS33_LACPA|nr:glycosyl transferase family protein [Lacticaseibacillus paracasei subsp. paracasei Lpp126]
MIFVTVGTHEQPFNRLMKAIDEFAVTDRRQEEIIVQYGFSTEIPKHVTDAQAFFSNVEMNRLISKARILITHGGPSTIIEGLQLKVFS